MPLRLEARRLVCIVAGGDRKGMPGFWIDRQVVGVSETPIVGGRRVASW